MDGKTLRATAFIAWSAVFWVKLLVINPRKNLGYGMWPNGKTPVSRTREKGVIRKKGGWNRFYLVPDTFFYVLFLSFLSNQVNDLPKKFLVRGWRSIRE